MEKNLFEIPVIEKKSIEELSAQLLKTSAELSVANERLLQSKKEREDLLSNISHDLRAPITAIRSAVDYLSSNPDADLEEYKTTLALIDRRTQNLECLIQDMYYLFCVENSSVELKKEPLMAAPFFETYFYDAIIDSRYDTHEMSLDIPTGLDARIFIDPERIVRVLDNLFTNAAKYTPCDSKITLKVSLDNSFIYASVIDTGEGIPEANIPHIFDRTYTVSTARTPGSGSGLGLSIAKAIIEKHQGTIECISTFGKGSTFTFSLPIMM